MFDIFAIITKRNSKMQFIDLLDIEYINKEREYYGTVKEFKEFED